MIIYDFPSGDVVVDTEQWSWEDNAYEWRLYLKRKTKQQEVYKDEPDYYTEDLLPF